MHTIPFSSLLRSSGLPGHLVDETLRRLKAAPTPEAMPWGDLRQGLGLPSKLVDELRFLASLESVTAHHAPLASLFPSEALVHALDQQGRTEDRALIGFFRANPDFDVGGAGVDAYLAEHPETFVGAGESDRALVVARVKQLQRLFRLTAGLPDQPGLILGCLRGGFESAYAIAQLDEQAFRERLAASAVAAQAARTIHRRASHYAAATLAMVTRHSPQFNAVRVAAIDGATPALVAADAAAATVGGSDELFIPPGNGSGGGGGGGSRNLPDWRSLFGSLDAYRSAQSALSPSAYLVDLLNLLDNLRQTAPDGDSTKTALDLLRERRPDIAHLEHTAANAETPMPYADLVNEVLESAVFAVPFQIKPMVPVEAGGKPSERLREQFVENEHELSADARVQVIATDARWEILDDQATFRIARCNDDQDVTYLSVTPGPAPRQTTGSADDLRVHREYGSDAVYKALRRQSYPWATPFDLWAEEARTYLKALGVERHELIALFGEDEEKREAAAAADYFGLTATERHLLAGARDALVRPKLWGFASTTDGWDETLSGLPVFLRHTGLSLEQLNDLLATQFVNPDQDPDTRIAVRFGLEPKDDPVATSPCDPDLARVIGLKGPKKDCAPLARIQRFLRLQRKTTWSIPEFDQVVVALGYRGDPDRGFDDTLLVRARLIDTWRRQFRLPLDELLSWVADLNTRPSGDGGASLFDRLFLDRSLGASTTAFALDAQRKTLKSAVSVEDPAARGVICAALQIDSRALERLMTAPWDASPPSTLDFAKLSEMYRWTSIARALRLSVDAMLWLRALVKVDDAKDFFALTRRFLESDRVVLEKSGLGVGELDFVLHGPVGPDVDKATDDAKRLLLNLRNALQTQSDASRQGKEHEGTDPSAFCAQSQARVADHFAEPLGLQAQMVRSLLFPSSSGCASDPGEVLLQPGFVTAADSVVEPKGQAPEAVQDALRLCRGLRRAAPLVQRLKLDGDLLEALRNAGLTQADTLLGQCLRGEPAAFADLETLANLAATRNRMGADAFDRLLKLVAAQGCEEEQRQARAELATLTGLAGEDIAGLLNGLAKPCSAAALSRFAAAAAVLKTLGVSAATAADWASTVLGTKQTHAIELTFKSRHDQQRWLEAAAPLRELLREKQRATLVACLLARLDLADSYALYQHYLIDVDMGPRMLTSRTRLAISAVQLFVQRLLMNLEDLRVPDDGTARTCLAQWQSLKNYRVWEASRKIFLYPENWIEPDLRRDKTALFRDLEAELLQEDFTASAAEKAMRRYLERLAELGRLEICALTVDNWSGPQVLHLFGRTRGVPPAYYYRRRESGVWTSWEPIEVGVEGQHLIPVVLDRRLYLFWPEFTPSTAGGIFNGKGHPGEGNKLTTVDNGGLTQTWDYWELSLAFSQFHDGRWVPKRLLRTRLAVDLPTGATLTAYGLNLNGAERPAELLPPKASASNLRPERRLRCETALFTFKAEVEDTSLRICCLKRTAADQQKYTDEGGFRFTADECASAVPRGGEATPPMAAQWVQGFHYDAMALAPNEGTTELELRDKTKLRLPRRLIDRDGIDDKRRDEFVSRGVRLIVTAAEPPRVDVAKAADLPFVYQDEDRAFLISPTAQGSGWRFENLYHPAAADFTRQLVRHGLDGLLQLGQQQRNRETVLFKLSGEKELEHAELEKNANYLKGRGALRDHGLKDFQFEWHADRPFALAIQEIDLAGKAGRRLECNVREEDGELVVFRDADQLYGATDLPDGEVDFSPQGAYSQYNWEIFFHLPLLLADRFGKNQRFEDAQHWFHRVFDPTNLSAAAPPQRYWKFRVFFDRANRPPVVQLGALALSNAKEWRDERASLRVQIGQWRRSPFDPHVIARLRTSAYQKAVVMKYIDNLVAWGDQLFRQDTIESINEATQHYLLAAEILGRRPLSLPEPAAGLSGRCAESTANTGDSEGARRRRDALAELEDLASGEEPEVDPKERKDDPSLSALCFAATYFTVPGNEKLLGYWDLVGDRLFKIRHSRNIEGVERQLALYEPPIDPGLLVRAAAAGVDIASVLRDLGGELPPYRFRVVLRTALDFCDEVCTLGADLLAALERKDAEGLEQLRSRQAAFTLQRQIADRAIDEAIQRIEELEGTRSSLNDRMSNYDTQIKGVEGKRGLAGAAAGLKSSIGLMKAEGDAYHTAKQWGQWESKEHISREVSNSALKEGWKEGDTDAGILAKKSSLLAIAKSMYVAGSSASIYPTLVTGSAGAGASPVALTVTGGGPVKDKMDLFAKSVEVLANMADVGYAAYQAVATRNEKIEDLKAEKARVGAELARAERQLDAARIRREILALRRKQIDKAAEDAAQVDGYLRTRFTSQELYSWRVGQLSTLHFQTYQLAYDLAKRAESAYAYELGLDRTKGNFVRFGLWDSLRKGLLAAEQLRLDLRRLQKAYLEANRRDYEITKHISLKRLICKKNGDDQDWTDFKKSGDFELTEHLFDADYDGHYLRRIKSVSVTIQSPHQQEPRSAHCKLELRSSQVRWRDGEDQADLRADGFIPQRAIVTSSGRDDSGLFELDLDDDRYLPFEGAGAISAWKITWYNADAVQDVQDVVLHLRYRARDGKAKRFSHAS